MNLTPEQLREDAANIECGTIINRAQVAKDYRAHASALERLAEVEARPEFVKAGDGTLHGAIDYWQRKASTLDERLAERDAEIARLKGHAEAMAEELENIEYGEGCKTRADKAYRADYPEK